MESCDVVLVCGIVLAGSVAVVQLVLSNLWLTRQPVLLLFSLGRVLGRFEVWTVETVAGGSVFLRQVRISVLCKMG